MSNNEVAVRLKKVCKTFRQYKSNMQKIQFLLLKRDVGTKEAVLSDISLEIKKGEKVGIIGSSQSGKTTLMRIIAGIIRPDSGKVTVNGGILRILDIRLGFDLSLSGKDNYMLMSTAMGRSADFIKEHEESVFEFAKLSEVKDEPVRTYPKGSAGILGFATATEIGDDIILYDAAFAFGSTTWNKACKKRLKKLAAGDTTLIMTVKKVADAASLCQRGIVLLDGRVAFDGAFDEAVEFYRNNRKGKSGDKAEGAEDEVTEDDNRSEDQYED